jgi:hypothetical protein
MGMESHFWGKSEAIAGDVVLSRIAEANSSGGSYYNLLLYPKGIMSPGVHPRIPVF